MGRFTDIFTGIFNNFTNGNIKTAAETVQTTTETITDIPIDLNYQKHLIDATNQVYDNQRQQASARLYCINKLEWEKTQSNIMYTLCPIIILIILIIIFVILYLYGIYNDILGILFWICIYIFIMISWYTFYLNYYKYKKSIKWNKVLLRLNTTKEFDKLNDFNELTNIELIKKIDEIFYQILKNK